MKVLPAMMVPVLLATLPACSMRKQPADGSTGEQIYRDSACATCHGEDLLGTGSAPTLLGLAENWEREALVEFLFEPSAFRKGNKRLVKLDLQFSADMPGFANLSDDERDRLAGFLLAQ
jgi:mono/diheme cytochrome c family protein